MSKETDQAIEALHRAVDEKKALSNSELDTARRMITAFEMVESWGRLAKLALWLLMAAASALIALDKIREGLGK